eukprot:TRINITY_DN15115_c0_g2_i2.p1 TRINITY_DN15115_c0_g2~~TRINITY_DN15115_c0_g2_i2.p1  ORF type:complete len:152 (+),score=36.20 TRINITY_DN15115_c0_g2_i2:360-815(+)
MEECRVPRRNESTRARLEFADDLADFQENDISERSDASDICTPINATTAIKELKSCYKSSANRKSAVKAEPETTESSPAKSEKNFPASFKNGVGEEEESLKGNDGDKDEIEVFTFTVGDADSAETKRAQASPIPKFKPHVISKKKWRGVVD